jgi:Nickel responsive protein SCO4226-like
MKFFSVSVIIATVIFASCSEPAKKDSAESTSGAEPKAQTDTLPPPATKSLFIDIHDVGPGKVNFAAVMAAHQKDLATEGKYDVNFIKFWVDEKKGKIFCLSSAKDTQSVIHTHAEAHGLLPSAIFKVTDDAQADAVDGKQFFIDVHNLGAGNVTAEAAAGAHSKDLAVEKKYGVNFINYWVDEKAGNIYCLSQAPDSNAIIHTHREAHGLLPAYVLQVKQGE